MNTNYEKIKADLLAFGKKNGASTMIIRSSDIECQVKDHSIARYVYENRIVVADDSLKVEKAKK